MDEESLPPNEETHYIRSRKKKREIFESPHLLIKQSPKADVGLIAALLRKDAVFRHSILGIHGKQSDLNQLAACCSVINTKIALYYEMLTSRSWLVERDAFEKEEIMNLPMPENILNLNISYEFIKELSKNPKADEINRIATDLYGLNESEIILIDDTIKFTLDSFRRKAKSIAFKQVDGDTIGNYVNTFCGVLNNSFSSPKKVFTGTVFLGDCPLSVVSARLVDKSKKSVEITYFRDNELEEILNKLDRPLIEEPSPSVYIRRILRRYSGYTVYIVKPNQMRYWTKSAALHDADETYADIMSLWGSFL